MSDEFDKLTTIPMSKQAMQRERIIEIKTNVDLDALNVPETYEETVSCIYELFATATITNVMTSWIVGKFVSLAAAEGKWGEGVVKRIADDLGKSPSLLYDQRRFFEAYPTLEDVSVVKGINWTSIRLLLSGVPDNERRAEYADRIRDENINSTELKAILDMEARANEPEPPEDPEEPEDGDEEPEEEEGHTQEARRYFEKLQAMLENFQEALIDKGRKLPEMRELAKNDELTGDADYDAIVNAGREISVTSRAILEFLNVNLVGLNRADAFADPEEG